MARMYSHKRGKAGSHKPDNAAKPKWLEYDKDEVERLVVKLRKQDMGTAMIGTVLKDRYGIPDVKAVTGKSVTKILSENKVAPDFPEDIFNLMKLVMVLRRHLTENKKDRHSKRGLAIAESKIRRRGKYYSRKGVLPKDWAYDPEKAKITVQ